MGEDAAGYLDARIDALREHLALIVVALPKLPAAFAAAHGQLAQDWQSRGPGTVLMLIAGFAGLGFIVEALYRAFVKRSEAARLRAIGLELARELGALAAFILGSAAVFVAFDWPPRTRQTVLAFLAAFVLFRLVLIVSRALFAPGDDRLRIVPVAEPGFAHSRVALFAGWLALGWVLITWLAVFGMDLPSRQIVAYAFGLVLLGIALATVWRRSRVMAAGFVVAWALWVLGAHGLFWLTVVAVTLPAILRWTQMGADNVLKSGVVAAAVGRGLRALAIVGAVWLVMHAFAVNMEALTGGETVGARLVRGAIQALAILLLADVAWLVIAALIDRNLAVAQGEAGSDEEANRRARLRTLLPIVRSVVLVVLIAMAVLMALSALGVEVAPLLAGAGVVGIAVGFGAQQLVRDLFAKFSYLLDDAFRLGEYIESGAYKGTVEHLGGRTIRLRHHRGPIFTIPYGQLGAIKNSSRDWVIDKMTIGVAYDTDLDQAKKILKKIGQALAADPEFAPDILEPLKMQGVEQFGEFAIQIRIKIKTRPNKQFTIRRRAYAMIKKAFAENGIHFAHPTVQVAGGTADAGAVAALRQGLELQKKSQP
jgi:small-conductance mechanosensitive channel